MVAGALLGVGVINSSVADENDPAFALLYEPISSSDPIIRSGAILGLALAYAGTGKIEVPNSAALHPSTDAASHVRSCCRRSVDSFEAPPAFLLHDHEPLWTAASQSPHGAVSTEVSIKICNCEVRSPRPDCFALW